MLIMTAKTKFLGFSIVSQSNTHATFRVCTVTRGKRILRFGTRVFNLGRNFWHALMRYFTGVGSDKFDKSRE
jgi:hypothetical protein